MCFFNKRSVWKGLDLFMHANKALSIPWHGPFIAAGLWRNRKALAKKKTFYPSNHACRCRTHWLLKQNRNTVLSIKLGVIGLSAFSFPSVPKAPKKTTGGFFHARSFMFCITARPTQSTSFRSIFCHGIQLESATVSGKGTLESQLHQSL